MYQIFVVVNVLFGEIDRVVESNRDIANIMWKDFMNIGCPIITVHDNKFKVWNVRKTHQPTIIQDYDWPEWAEKEWNIRKTNNNHLGSKLIDFDYIGCYELRHTSLKETGMKEIERIFYTYGGEELFSVTEYD